MQIHNLSKREKTLVIGTITLAIVVGLYVFVIEPSLRAWFSVDDSIQAYENKLVKNLRLVARYNILKHEYEKYPELLESTSDEEQKFTSIFNEIEAVSKHSNCRIINAKPRAAKKYDDYKELSYDISLEGTIIDISKFVHEIEKSKVILRIKHLTITAKSEGSDMLKANLIINKIISL